MTVYYIDPSMVSVAGFTPDGLAPETAYRLFSDVPALAAGDTVRFRRGTTHRGTVTVNASGTAILPINLMDYGDADEEAPVICGSNNCHGFIKFGTEIVSNPLFTNWTAGAPDDWTVTATGSSAVTEETSDPYIGTSDVKFEVDTATSAVDITQDFETGDFTDNTDYRASFTFKHDDATLGITFSIYRTTGDPYEYLQADGSWGTSQALHFMTPPNNSGTGEWVTDFLDFNTGANAQGAVLYHIQIAPYTIAPSSSIKDFYLSTASIGEIGGTSTNLLTNGGFEDSLSTGWTRINEDDTTLERDDNERFGSYGLKMVGGVATASDVGVSQSISLTSGTIYRVSFHHHKNAAQGDLAGKVGVQLIRDSDGYYWDGGVGVPVFQAAEVDAKEYEEFEYTIEPFTFQPSATGSYTFVFHRSIDNPLVQYETYFLDDICVQATAQTSQVYQAYWAGEPNNVFVTGTLNGETVDHHQLHDDGNGTYPHQNCYTYSSSKLYVNVGEDLTSCDVEIPFRTNNVDFAGYSYIRAKNLTLTKAKGDGLLLGWDSATPPENFIVDNCTVEYSEDGGIIGGYRNDDPEISDAEPEIGAYVPPKDVTIQDCTVQYWNRARKMRIYYNAAGTTAWRDQWGSPQWGIGIFPGTKPFATGDDHGTMTIRRNTVQNDYPVFNLSTERNGIEICAGNEVVIEDNYLTGMDHGIVVFGVISQTNKWYGDTRTIHIRRNFCYKTGDDNIWVRGVGASPVHICYNVLVGAGDNALDFMTSLNTYFYNNFIDGTNCENGSLIFWGSYPGAFIYCLNNIFYNWGGRLRGAKPGQMTGCAIELQQPFWADTYIEDSWFDYNIFYNDTGNDNADQPIITVAGEDDSDKVQYTLEEWQDESYGFEANGSYDDPEIVNYSGGSYYIETDSPCFRTGVDLSTYEQTVDIVGTTVTFPYANAQEQLLATTSSWPSSVSYDAQPTSWNIGPWQMQAPSITASGFDTDKSLVGCPVFAVDETNKRIWKGLITSNTATVLTLDEWEPLFNAEGYYPYGSITYYIGYLYLYDQSPGYAYLTNEREKTLGSYELLTNRLASSGTLYTRLSINQGDHYNVKSTSMSGDRTTVYDLGGLHRLFQLEHALLSIQKVEVKMQSYIAEFSSGRTDK